MRTLAMILALLMATATKAQDDLEYRMEVGGSVGLMSCQGDFNGSIISNQQPAATITARYKPNPRMAWGMNITYGTLKGDYKDAKNYYPDLDDNRKSFKNGTVDAGVRYEYNFWPYGTGNDYRGAKRLTPFITIGAGMTFTNTKGGNVTAVNFPIGGGVKYKMGKRLNFVAEWTMHFSTSDKLDHVDDPYGIKSSGMFKNKDSYGVLSAGVTYDLWAKCRTCHNDDF